VKKPSPKVRTRLVADHMSNRAKTAIDKLIASGSISQEDLISLCNRKTKKEVSLLSVDQQQDYFKSNRMVLKKEQYLALAKHFHISLLWLWTGHGPQFINTTNN
jgi:hypothetical protein